MPGRISELTALVMAVLSQCKYETDGVYRGTIEWEEKEKRLNEISRRERKCSKEKIR